MASCFSCFKPWRDNDQLQEERLKAFKELEDIQAGVGNEPARADLWTPDIAAKLIKKVGKPECDVDGHSNPETASSVDGDRASQQQTAERARATQADSTAPAAAHPSEAAVGLSGEPGGANPANRHNPDSLAGKPAQPASVPGLESNSAAAAAATEDDGSCSSPACGEAAAAAGNIAPRIGESGEGDLAGGGGAAPVRSSGGGSSTAATATVTVTRSSGVLEPCSSCGAPACTDDGAGTGGGVSCSEGAGPHTVPDGKAVSLSPGTGNATTATSPSPSRAASARARGVSSNGGRVGGRVCYACIVAAAAAAANAAAAAAAAASVTASACTVATSAAADSSSCYTSSTAVGTDRVPRPASSIGSASAAAAGHAATPVSDKGFRRPSSAASGGGEHALSPQPVDSAARTPASERTPPLAVAKQPKSPGSSRYAWGGGGAGQSGRVGSGSGRVSYGAGGAGSAGPYRGGSGRLYGAASMGLATGRSTPPPPPPGMFTSASTRLALHDVLHHRSRGMGAVGRGGFSVTSLANIDFRPAWRC